jgi:hypothetical protein
LARPVLLSAVEPYRFLWLAGWSDSYQGMPSGMPNELRNF